MEKHPDTYAHDGVTTPSPAPRSRMEFYATENGGNIVRYDSRSSIHSGCTLAVHAGPHFAVTTTPPRRGRSSRSSNRRQKSQH